MKIALKRQMTCFLALLIILSCSDSDPCELAGSPHSITGVIIWGPGLFDHGNEGYFVARDSSPSTIVEFENAVPEKEVSALVFDSGVPEVVDALERNPDGIVAFGEWRGIYGRPSNDCPLLFADNALFRVSSATNVRVLK